ncbi:putative Kinase [Melia azedarach]|uniref:Kinase n=1 Tax=Melia azedarach TaxID=155640 RepID=A0ACC1WXV2_MELAZ|nr:putative Kinase [Melia azedarach]
MVLIFKLVLLLLFLSSSCLWTSQILIAARLPQAEVNALNQIAKTIGAPHWTFDADNACQVHLKPAVKGVDPTKNITCKLGPDNTSHITTIEFKRCNLSGVLPPELVQFPFLERVDFSYNYLNGSIPAQWASMQLKFIVLFANRLSGNIPSFLGNITSLTYLDIEINQFSGTVPAELGKLVNLETLRLSSNGLSGNLPMELAELKHLTDFRISDNNFNGSIPEFIQNWKQLWRLEIQGSGLEGPIPSSISVFENLNQLRISDIAGTDQDFPDLRNMTRIRRIILRNCSILGGIPEYIWGLTNLHVLDLSFNKLTGELPTFEIPGELIFIFLTGNFLSGNIPVSILKKGTSVDLSYNNFNHQSPEQPACRERQNLNLNLYRSSFMKGDLSGVLPCTNDLKCHRYRHSLFINCGGKAVKVNGTTFVGDANGGGTAAYYSNDDTNWGFITTGDFQDDNDEQNTHYIANLDSSDISELYINARIAPISLTYFGYCLQHGNYTLNLHFAEIQFTDDNTFHSLGRRIFDIYIQDKLVEKDFNIAAEASAVRKPVVRSYNVTVTNNILEIRLNWGGKGTTAIPRGGVYGPLISAISVVDPNFKQENKTVPIVIGIVVAFSLILLVFGIIGWKYYFRNRSGQEKDSLLVSDLQTTSFTLKQIKAATNNFDPLNKIGEGGFGPVYKGVLADGTIIAVKQLSSKSRQGNREFLNEIGMISCLQHPNLVKLHGCCIEGDELLLVYEYMENNSLARALFGRENTQLELDWPTRQKICLGIARGLSFLHEESRFKIVHRDIKATNVLLDRDLNPKISDFGLAKLDEEEKTHISTRIAGTIGYMAPEYALWGYLTYKADVYSFGVVALEIVSGKNNMSYSAASEIDCICLIDWACYLQQGQKLIELVDPRLGLEYNKEEAERMIKVSILCTNVSPSLRPTMSEIVSMLEGNTAVPDIIPEAGSYSQDLRFKTLRDHQMLRPNWSSAGASSQYSSSEFHHGSSSAPAHDLYEISEESYLTFKAMRDGYKMTKSNSPDVQLSTTTRSWTGTSSTSAHDLYNINSSSS